MKIISKKNNPGLDSIIEISTTTKVLELRVLEAVKEASISVACLLDDVSVEQSADIELWELQKDIEHLQDQITIIENNMVRIQEKK